MNPIRFRIPAVVALALAAPSYASQVCEVKSGVATAALVELYTSEGRRALHTARSTPRGL